MASRRGKRRLGERWLIAGPSRTIDSGPEPSTEPQVLRDRPSLHHDTVDILETVEGLGDRFEQAAAPVSPAPFEERPRQRIAPPGDRGPDRPEAAALPTGRTLLPGRRLILGRRPKWERRYLIRLLLADFFVGLIAGAVAFNGRFGVSVDDYNRVYLVRSALLPVALLTALAINRAYENRFLYVGTEEYQRVIRAGLLLTATVAVGSYAFEARFARGYLLIAFPLATLACLLARFLIRNRLHQAREQGQCLRRVIVVGHDLAVASVTRQLRRERYHGFEPVGCCLPAGVAGASAHVPLPVCGAFDDVASAVRVARADTVVVLSCPELDGHAFRRLAWQLETDAVDLIVASSLIDVAGARTTIRPVDGLPKLHVDHPRLTGVSRWIKEVVDRLGAMVLLLVFAPLLLVVAVLIRWDSPGPVMFRQVRVGRDGRPFVIYKFRTMHIQAEQRLAQLKHLNEQDAVLFKMRHDPRVTRIGTHLRRYSIDELPQLLNVVRGQMSLVGPRPPLPEEVAAYHDDVHRRLVVKPGMTGLWQVSGRSDLSWEEAVRLDLRYVENWTLTLDLVILLRTAAAVFRTSGAY